jgi:hypothetical protein
VENLAEDLLPVEKLDPVLVLLPAEELDLLPALAEEVNLLLAQDAQDALVWDALNK